MLQIAIKRLIQSIPTLLGMTLIAFVLLNWSGDPTYVLMPEEATEEQREAFREEHGLNDPLPIQYAHFVFNTLRGDLGESITTYEPALDMVLDRLPATLQLAGSAFVLALITAVPMGVIAAYKRGSIVDRLLMGLVLLGQSVPTFWLGMLLIMFFSVRLEILPVSGRGGLQHLILPSIALAVWLLALLGRITRSEMLEVLNQDFVRTARAKGLREIFVIGHAFRNVLISLITTIGIQVSGLLGGALMVEIVFAWPGIGTLIYQSILRRDQPVVLATLLLVAMGTILVNLLADVLYSVVDPRVRTGAGA